LVALVIIAMLLLVMPVPMAGMESMGWCPACLTGHASQILGLCLAILVSTVLVMGLSMSGSAGGSRAVFNQRLLTSRILRPPRFASGL
jgi:hypothetical protein